MNNLRHIVILAILLILFLVMGFMVMDSAEGILFDMAILDAIHKSNNPVIFNIMKFISFIGSEKFLFPAIGFVIIISIINKRYFVSKFLLFNTLGSFLFNHLLKQVFQRTRPLDFFLVEQGGLSYPSGHSMVVMTMYLAIAYLLTREERDPRRRRRVYIIASIIILLMGISRIYLGVHWPSDIVGGFIMGYIFYSISRLLIRE
ncbi:MAG TPA: phosphatase PAP2 family protein [Tissierellaceae bacterium]|nr:phosphatase PAP2 family protein [Tissierellaceae bacterium]